MKSACVGVFSITGYPFQVLMRLELYEQNF